MGSLLAALGLVFVAELGDKTQLVALGMGARHRLAPLLVGVGLAYSLSNLLSVVVGGLLGAALPTRALAIAGGILFLLFAAWNIRAAGEADGEVDEPARHGHEAARASDPDRFISAVRALRDRSARHERVTPRSADLDRDGSPPSAMPGQRDIAGERSSMALHRRPHRVADEAPALDWVRRCSGGVLCAWAPADAAGEGAPEPAVSARVRGTGNDSSK
tara:strand:- start:440 stop:1093 length:654 start_codon:yes stop_codon:yes gene_type:complete